MTSEPGWYDTIAKIMAFCKENNLTAHVDRDGHLTFRRKKT